MAYLLERHLLPSLSRRAEGGAVDPPDAQVADGRPAEATDLEAPITARAILGGIEMIHMMRKQQAKYARNLHPSLAEQFEILAA
jgi:hypothetical protein